MEQVAHQQKATELLIRIVDHFRQAMESDEDINGADAVDYLCGWWSDADLLLKERAKPLPPEHVALIAAAREEYANDDIEIDEDAALSESDEGTWVQGWLFVRREEDEYEEGDALVCGDCKLEVDEIVRTNSKGITQCSDCFLAEEGPQT